MIEKKSILVLLKGNLISQVLPIVFYPLITRLFSSHDFGVYSTVLSIIMTITVISIMKLDQALPISNDAEKEKLIRVGILINIFISIFLFLALYCISFNYFGEILNLTNIIIIPVTVFINGLSNLLIGLNVSLGQFAINSKYQIYRSISITLLQIIFGVIGFLKYGLVISFLISQLISLLYLIFVYKDKLKNITRIKNLNEDVKLLKNEYIDFPKFLATTSLVNTLGVNLPNILFTITYGLVYSGYYGLITRALFTPLNMISISIAQPFLKDLGENKDSKEKISQVVQNVFILLSSISIIPICLFSFNMEYLFSIIFSEEWKFAGKISLFIIPWITINFILSPMTHVYTVTRTQKFNLFMNVFSIIIRILVILISFKLELSFINMIMIFGVSNMLISLLQLVFILSLVNLEKVLLLNHVILPLMIGVTISFSLNYMFSSIVSTILAIFITALYIYLIKNRMRRILI